jgi:hypothetical protein
MVRAQLPQRTALPNFIYKDFCRIFSHASKFFFSRIEASPNALQERMKVHTRSASSGAMRAVTKKE